MLSFIFIQNAPNWAVWQHSLKLPWSGFLQQEKKVFGLCFYLPHLLSDPSGLTGWPTSRPCTAFLGNVESHLLIQSPASDHQLLANPGLWSVQSLMWSMGFPPTSTPSKDPGKLLSRSKFGHGKSRQLREGLAPPLSIPQGWTHC